MRIAAAAAKSSETKKIVKQSPVPVPSPVPSRPSSPHGTADNIASPQAPPFPAKSSICRLQGVNSPISHIFDYLVTV